MRFEIISGTYLPYTNTGPKSAFDLISLVHTFQVKDSVILIKHNQ
jgi:hypothetical protein